MLLLTAILLQGSFLCGMERVQPPFKKGEMPEAQPIQALDRLSQSLRDDFDAALKEYEEGNKIIAGNKLYEIYGSACLQGKRDILSFCGFGRSQLIYNRIGITQALQGNYTLALKFTKKSHPNDDTATTNRGIYLTKLAEKTTDPLLQTQYYNEAFGCFKKAAPFDYIAQKHYFHALTNGIGCTSPSQEISNYFTQNIKYNKNESQQIAALKNFELFAKKGNMLAQCMLATAYYSGSNGLPQSTEKSLLMCRYYLQSLAQCPKMEQLPIQRFIFDRIIQDLSDSDQPLIRDNATMLKKYRDLFMADIKGDQRKVELLAGKEPLYKLLCKNCTLSDAYIKKIKSMKPDDQQVKNITELEKSILRDMAAYPSTNNEKRTTILNYVCGIVAYNDKNYKKAYHYLSQCTTYTEHDLLTNYLILESHCRMQKNDAIIVQKNLDLMTRINTLINKADPSQKLRERDAYTQKKIIAFYQELDKSYGIALVDAQQYNLAYQFIGHLLAHRQTTEQALFMLLQAERKINDPNAPLTVDPNLRNVTDAKVDDLNHKNLSIETLIMLAEYLSEKALRPSLSLEQKSNYLKQALKHLPHHDSCKNPVSAEWCKLLRMKVATTIGILDKSIPYLNEAITLGSIDAKLQKIHLLMELPSQTPAEAQELIELMTQICQGDHPERFHLCNALAYCYYKSSEMEDRKKAFDYLHQATNADSNEYVYLLGTLYLKGIPHHVEADAEKALYYFNKQTTFNQNISNKHLIALKSHAYYKQEKYQEALDILIPNIPLESTSLRAEFAWLIGMIKIQLFNEKIMSDEVINYCVEAYNMLHQCPSGQCAPIESIQAITDEKFLKIAEQKTAHILLTNNTTAQAVEFCNIIGQLLWRAAEDQPVTHERRKTAIKYLRYAADNNNANAQEFAIYTSKEEISSLDKIYYLESACVNRVNEGSEKASKIQEILNEWYPETLAQQAILISHYIKKNNISVLQKYIQQLYTTYAPYITLEISQDAGNGFIQTCYGNEFLVQAAHNFIQNPAQATPLQKYAAIFLGSILAYSYDQKELLQAARYLEHARLSSVKQNERIKENKSILYYKLGCLASDSKNPRANSALATMYYQKSADLGNQAAQLEMYKLCGFKLTFVPTKTAKK